MHCCAALATMPDPVATFALAERVAEEALKLGFECALIGATALAIHGYARGTEDIDLAVSVDPQTSLTALQRALDTDGLQTELRLPDDDDPIGVLTVQIPSADETVPPEVEVVNFRNPARFASTPAPAAIALAELLPGTSLRCVTLEDLVAFKLYAGSRSDLADIERLLASNADADLEAVRRVAGPFDRSGELEDLIASARAMRGDRSGLSDA